MSDPTKVICEQARAFPDVVEGMSCNQSSFKAKKSKFLFIGPGPKGKGYKAMFKLEQSIEQAQELATKEPERYKVGASGGWITVLFTEQKPIPKGIWQKWLKESYQLSC
ncbi:MmcQ/YjbR family DNA-binding protein [Pleionea sp. CnH1-48]|uniref:MmcQ/YjbR family DNA-binding protein n=1 Tax=Pleionea sp. CnH1-48 TaxID=2954494 RepID=UPI002097B64D|nr:MmcQ/YjbR family DNA-binding protein [Pleionea sp. CnH1-48]MCO7223521.1 MmcQ/YjbR family DNA-binding protein [Pleionea sp. CnH1-48]